MKLIEALSATVLFLLPAAITPAFAQRGHEEEKQPQQKQQQARPAQQPRQAQHEQQARPAQQPKQAQHQQQARPAQQPKQAQHQQQARPAQQPRQAQHEQQARPAQQPKQAQHQQQARPAQQQANRSQPAGSHGRIPDDRFRASFGRDHRFHVNRSDFEGGSRRFQYGGFWFNVLDPWPVGWLYTDDVYVDYINGGYFLCDPVHPGVYISINIG
jgi:outer membrane biosynthesis protein TonB